MNHYCTYFDAGFLGPGLALWKSLSGHDRTAVLWVLALDDVAAAALASLRDPSVRVVTLSALETADPALRSARSNRSRIGYYFTLSPCWPRFLLEQHSEIARLTYLDADLFFFSEPEPVFAAMDAAGASVLITRHRFPPWLRHYERHGRFNVGILSFRNDAAGRGCLDDWRARCLEWCEDRLEGARYGDQKYLDDWPARLGPRLIVLEHPGVNLAPWNWMTHRIEVEKGAGGRVRVDGEPLVVFHFARFRKLSGRWWQSGQLDYGVMPRRLREAIYVPYLHALEEAAAGVPGTALAAPGRRAGRDFWRALPLRLVFGGNWWSNGNTLLNLRLGLGVQSGRALAAFRRLRARD